MFVQCTVKNHLLLFFCLSLSSPISYIMIWKLNTYMKGINDKNSSRQKDSVLITVCQRIVLEFAPSSNERLIKTAAIQSLYSALWKTICSFFLSVSQLPNFIYNDMEIEYLHEGNRWQEFQQTKRSGSCGTRVPEGCCARETSCEVIITVSSLETLRFKIKINTPSTWLTLLLFLGKNRVNQV